MQIDENFPSPNYANRNLNIEYIILHYTELNLQDSLVRLTDPLAEVSSHYLIAEDGKIFRLVEDTNIAWHAGVSYWQGQEKLNQNSLGIELVNLGDREFPLEQMQQLIILLKMLIKQHNIPVFNILGHSDIAPQRKIDPGIFFNWQMLAEHNIGLWHDLEIDSDEQEIILLSQLRGQEIYDIQEKLRKIGYNIQPNPKVDEHMNMVVRSFQSRFYPGIIKNKGIEFYRNFQSQYYWSNKSSQILDSLFKKLSN